MVSIKGKVNVVLLLFTWFSLMIIGCKKEPKEVIIQKNEFFFIIDTSGSMAYGPFQHIQKKFEDFLTLIKTGDSIYIIKFDVEPILLKKIDNYDIINKDEIINLIKELKPIGRYTDIQLMLDYTKNLVMNSKLEETYFDETKNEIRKIQKTQFIIVFSDGKDEPPKKRNVVNLNEYRTSPTLPIEDRYVYYVNFSRETSKQIEEGLKEQSKEVRVIQRPLMEKTTDNAKTEDEISSNNKPIDDPSGIEELKENIQQKQQEIQEKSESSFWQKFQITAFEIFEKNKNFLLLLLLVSIVILSLYFLLRYLYNRFKSALRGEIIYYEVGSHPSMGKTIKLSRFEKNKLTIGNDPDCLIRIRSRDFPTKIVLKPIEKNDHYFFKVPKRFQNEIQFLSKDSNQNVIFSGDKFKIKNYIFEFSYGSKSKNY
ncbi:MAG: VWA domain-containing protein [Leptospiraceae bacterium]|nr:VWA domain-containing protein [Leptospiraceae bacterium]MDW7976144.1 VWA domain-containing protein [Leptospiraceae bacterium]